MYKKSTHPDVVLGAVGYVLAHLRAQVAWCTHTLTQMSASQQFVNKKSTYPDIGLRAVGYVLTHLRAQVAWSAHTQSHTLTQTSDLKL